MKTSEIQTKLSSLTITQGALDSFNAALFVNVDPPAMALGQLAGTLKRLQEAYDAGPTDDLYPEVAAVYQNLVAFYSLSRETLTTEVVKEAAPNDKPAVKGNLGSKAFN